MLRPRHLELGKETDRETGGERDPEKEREQGQSWGSPDKDWGSGQAWGGAWGLGGWKRREGASRAGVPRAAGGRRAEPGPAAAAEPGAGPAPPPPAVMSAGPLLKGQAARRGSERGLGAAGKSMGVLPRCWGNQGEPQHPTGTSPGKAKAAGTKRHRGSPREPAKLWGSFPSEHTDVGTPFNWPARVRDYIFRQPWRRGAALGGKGPPRCLLGTVVYWDCSFHHPHLPAPASGSRQRGPEGASACLLPRWPTLRLTGSLVWFLWRGVSQGSLQVSQ